MKITQVLNKHHIGRQIRFMWHAKGKQIPANYNVENKMKSFGIDVIDPLEFLKPKKEIINFRDFKFLKPFPVLNDNTHPDWHDTPCLTYEDNNVLVEGVPQAQLITKTLIFDNSLPDVLDNSIMDLPGNTNKMIKRIIRTSAIFDAYQELLPKIKDSERPAFVFPRQMGITDVRKILNLSKRFVQLCDNICGPEVANKRSVIDDVLICLPFEKNLERFKCSLTMDMVLMSDKPLWPASQLDPEHNFAPLPDLHPLHYTIGVNKQNIYKFDNLFPLTSGYNKKHIHTIFVFYDGTQVKNTTELQVMETQALARSIMKAFTAAASSARQRFGLNVKELPEPVTVQCIQSDGKGFDFIVYQLNTLNLDESDGVKNYCWTLPKMELYNTADYVRGRPILDAYNPEVFKRILAFYKNN